MKYLHSLLVFALFEDVLFSYSETAGYVRFALFTSGYGYSPPSAPLWQATKSSARTLCYLAVKPQVPFASLSSPAVMDIRRLRRRLLERKKGSLS